MKIKNDDITNANETLILHQVNCQNAMGTGVAKALFTKWLDVKTKYHEFCKNKKPEELLGLYCCVNVSEDKYGPIVVNCFTQLTYGTQGKHTDYEAIKKCWSSIVHINKTLDIDYTVAIPYLYGCGLGGGDWNIVSNLIEEIFGDKAVIYKLDN